MSLKIIREAIQNKKMLCPQCNQPIQKFDKYIEMTQNVWDGPGDSGKDMSTVGSKVTLTCGNAGCDWSERTEYWSNYLDEN